MIIKRRYVSLYYLMMHDIKSKQIIMKAFENSKITNDEVERIIVYHNKNNTRLVDVETGSGIPNMDYIKTSFDRLDDEYPFDNMFSLSDVTDVKLVDYDDESQELILYLICKKYELNEIVKVEKLYD